MAIDKTQTQSQGTPSSSTATKPSSNRGTQESQNAAAAASAATTTRSGMRPEVERHIRTETGEAQSSRGRGLARTGGAASGALAAGNPFRLMQRMAQDMDQLFEQFGMGRAGFSLSPAANALFNDPWNSSGMVGTQQTLWSPDVELFQRDDKLVVRADLPGVRKEDLQIDVQNDVLTLSGQRQEQHEESREGWYHSERSYGSFCRAIPLPEGTNADNADATFKDGVLEVTLNAPKQEARNTRRIAIR